MRKLLRWNRTENRAPKQLAQAASQIVDIKSLSVRCGLRESVYVCVASRQAPKALTTNSKRTLYYIYIHISSVTSLCTLAAVVPPCRESRESIKLLAALMAGLYASLPFQFQIYA